MAGLSFKDQHARAQTLWDMYYRNGKSVREIAQELDMSTQAIYAFFARRDWDLRAITNPPERPT